MTQNPTNGIAKHIQELVTELKNKALRIEELENEVKLLKAGKKDLEEITIPDAMLEHGVQQLTLMTGDIVTVKPFYYARLFKETIPFLTWMRQNGFGGLIKEEVKIIPTVEEMQAVLDLLAEIHVYYEQNSNIHWKTLEAWYRECCEAGVNLPLDLFQNYTGNKAKITEKR